MMLTQVARKRYVTAARPPPGGCHTPRPVASPEGREERLQPLQASPQLRLAEIGIGQSGASACPGSC